MGMRAQESDRRARHLQFIPSVEDVGIGWKRIVDEWLPVKWWTIEEVWNAIRDSGVRYHWAYDEGMSRLSCCFCINAAMDDLLIAGKNNPEVLDLYVETEKAIDYGFKSKTQTIKAVKDALDAGAVPKTERFVCSSDKDQVSVACDDMEGFTEDSYGLDDGDIEQTFATTLQSLITALDGEDIPGALKAYLRWYPHVEIKVKELDTAGDLDGLQDLSAGLDFITEGLEALSDL